MLPSPAKRLAGALLCALSAGASHAQDDPLALSCAVCHGTPAAPSAMPDFYGLPAARIAELLRAFRAGDREGVAMPRLAAALSDAQIDTLARTWGRAVSE